MAELPPLEAVAVELAKMREEYHLGNGAPPHAVALGKELRLTEGRGMAASVYEAIRRVESSREQRGS